MAQKTFVVTGATGHTRQLHGRAVAGARTCRCGRWPSRKITEVCAANSSHRHRLRTSFELQEIDDNSLLRPSFPAVSSGYLRDGPAPRTAMSSLQQPLDRATAGVAGRTRHYEVFCAMISPSSALGCQRLLNERTNAAKALPICSGLSS